MTGWLLRYSWRKTVGFLLWASPSVWHKMSIQPPPLLCQLWTGLIYSGSFLPLSFPGLLYISFKQILLEDRKSIWSKSNIVQRVHTLQQLTNENGKFGSILYPIRKYSGNILDTPGTFVLHSKYIRRTFYVFQLHFVWILGRSNRIRQPF